MTPHQIMWSCRSRASCALLHACLVLTGAYGCGRSTEKISSATLLPRAAVQVQPAALADYVGVYRLPSGALLPILQQGDRLFAGSPPSELFPQSTRRFTSARFLGELCFDRGKDGAVRQLDYRIAKRSNWCPRLDMAENSDPTQLVDAGGHKLRLLSIGRGKPTIVLEDGFGNSIEMQSPLHAALAKVSRVVAYDHAGTGGSEAGPHPRNARQVARELRIALANAGIEPPFLLVGGSIGADYCRVFAAEFPADTAALVLLDPTPDWDALVEWAKIHAPTRVKNYRRMVTESETAMNILMQQQEPARRAEWEELSVTRQQAQRALPMISAPTVQITGASGRRFSSTVNDKVEFFDAWLADNAPSTRHVLATHSAHAVSITDQALVADEVMRQIAALAE